MPDGQSLEFSGVTKRFGAVTAVSDLSARVEPGRVTGFLGPNGAGKTTTLRILLGLVRATSGHATIGGQRLQIGDATTFVEEQNPSIELGEASEVLFFDLPAIRAN